MQGHSALITSRINDRPSYLTKVKALVVFLPSCLRTDLSILLSAGLLSRLRLSNPYLKIFLLTSSYFPSLHINIPSHSITHSPHFHHACVLFLLIFHRFIGLVASYRRPTGTLLLELFMTSCTVSCRLHTWDKTCRSYILPCAASLLGCIRS